MRSVALATEDQLSEAIGKRLLAAARPALQAGLVLRQNGEGYLRKKMKSWCQMARNGQPLLLLTDLDREACPLSLIENWSEKRSRPTDLVFRVAVREVEAWLLADHLAMQRLLGTAVRLPPEPELLPDPKQHLLELAKRAPRSVRTDLVVERGAIAAQGLGYNARLCALVDSDWSPERAAERSASLGRARLRIDEVARRLERRS